MRLLTPAQTAIELDEEASALLMEAAIRTRSRLQLAVDDAEDAEPIEASIVAGDHAKLVIQLERHCDVDTGALDEEGLRAHVTIDDERYLFEARCIRPVPRSHPLILYLVRPKLLCLLQRRRSRRYRFRRPTAVLLFTDDGTDDEPWPGCLLNLSPDGIACRVGEDHARLIRIGALLRVRFRIGESGEPFDLKGRLQNVTEGGSERQAVLGIEFLHEGGDAADKKAGLRRVLGLLAFNQGGW